MTYTIGLIDKKIAKDLIIKIVRKLHTKLNTSTN